MDGMAHTGAGVKPNPTTAKITAIVNTGRIFISEEVYHNSARCYGSTTSLTTG